MLANTDTNQIRYHIYLYIFIYVIATFMSMSCYASNNNSIEKMNFILNKLESEFINPSSNERALGSYLTQSEKAIRKYIEELAALDPNISDSLYSRQISLIGKTKTAVIISLGFMGKSQIHGELINILTTDQNTNLRAMAALALAKYADISDVPLLIQALRDTSHVIMEMDYSLPNGEFSQIIYPLRMAANNALVEMGYRITKNKQTGELIVRKEK